MTTNPKPDRLLYTTDEAAELLALSPSYLKRAATAEALPHTRVGRYVRWSEKDLAAIIAQGQAGHASTPPEPRGRSRARKRNATP